MHDRFPFFGLNVRILLLRLASLGAASRPLSRRWRWSGLGSCGGGCILNHNISRNWGSGSVDSRVRAFIRAGFWYGRIDAGNLLVHESKGANNAPIRRGRSRKETTDSRLRSSSVSCRFGRGGWPSSERSWSTSRLATAYSPSVMVWILTLKSEHLQERKN
jgi:hypothetical protein